jgi:hypothetical protein
MSSRHDGPASPLFEPIPFRGNTSVKALSSAKVSETMRAAAARAPTGRCTAWGIPFEIRRPLLVDERPVTVQLGDVKAQWLVFLHTTDVAPLEPNASGFISPTRGDGRLGEPVADYVIVYADGSEVRERIRRRHQIGMLQRRWGEACFEAVAMRKPHPVLANHEQVSRFASLWGLTQTRVLNRDQEAWCNYLWAFENRHPRRAIAALRVEPAGGPLVLSALAAGKASSHPLRWEARRKAVLKLPRGEAFERRLDRAGNFEQIRLDLGQVISAQLRPVYPNDAWAKTYDRQLPELAKDEVLVEYSAHPDARFHLPGGRTARVADVENGRASGRLRPVAPATQRVTLRVVDRTTKQPVPVKLHVHGEAGEYLAPTDRHRIPNPSWFEDYSTDFVAADWAAGRFHWTTYIPGETVLDLPLGAVYIEVSRGFEIQPVRKGVRISKRTRTLTIPIEKVLPWRERGWVTADTHVHFLSPKTAQLEGAAEGVNVINLLASQWGELMTNVGDFDGETTFGSREAGGDGEWLVRVGTENRQHVLGHISLLGYRGDIIAPMCAGGPDEAALGDPVGVLLTEWARQCREKGGLVVFPHFPEPRAENAAALIHGDVDAVEMCSIGNEFTGIDPYSLSDWYRYLSCGYLYPAVGGTDKMAATTAVGTVRTYARIPDDQPFTYDSWMQAVRSGHTFVSYGPLLEFRVEGRAPGQRIQMRRSGGTVDVEYELASVTIPMTRVELVVNGEVRESRRVGARQASGHWSVPVDRSSWLALLVRAKQPDRDEIVAAHSSPVAVQLDGSRFFAAADAVTILEQIEGAIAYLDTIGTRAEERARKRMRLVLTSAHRKLHNEMHRQGRDHVHTPVHAHPEHERR